MRNNPIHSTFGNPPTLFSGYHLPPFHLGGCKMAGGGFTSILKGKLKKSFSRKAHFLDDGPDVAD
jgi:hypothetical protein